MDAETSKPFNIIFCVNMYSRNIGIAAEIHAVPMEDRDKIDGLPPKRKDVIVGAALLMCEVMDYLGKSEITVSESDNQEGYLKFKLGQIS